MDPTNNASVGQQTGKPAAEASGKPQVVKFTFSGLSSPQPGLASLPQPAQRQPTSPRTAHPTVAAPDGVSSVSTSWLTAGGAAAVGASGSAGQRASAAHPATAQPAQMLNSHHQPHSNSHPPTAANGVHSTQSANSASPSGAPDSSSGLNARLGASSLPSHSQQHSIKHPHASTSAAAPAPAAVHSTVDDSSTDGFGVRGGGSSSSVRTYAASPYIYAPGSWEPQQWSDKYHFVTFPADPLPPSYIRSQIAGDDEAWAEFDDTVWYQATAEELARDKERAVERERLKREREEKELKRRQERGKNKLLLQQREKDARQPGGARKAAKQRRKKLNRDKRPRQLRPQIGAATSTKFGRVNAASLFPDQELFTLPLTGIPGYVDLDELPSSYRLDPRDEYRRSAADAPGATTAEASVEGGPSGEATPGTVDGDGQSWTGKAGLKEQPKPKSTPMKTSESSQGLAKRAREDDIRPSGNKRKKVGGSATPVPLGSPGDDSLPPSVSGPYSPDAVVADYSLQATSCLSKRAFGCIQCYSCVARAVGHACCFQGLRFFPVTKDGLLAGPPCFRTPQEADDKPQWKPPAKFTAEVARELKAAMARYVLPFIEQEWKHTLPSPQNDYEPVKIRQDLRALALCDTCLVNMPSASWICESCGRESCDACRKALIELEQEEEDDQGLVLSLQQARRKKCIAKKRGSTGPAGWGHSSSQFVPLMRYSKKQMDKIYQGVKDWAQYKAQLPAEVSAQLVKSSYILFDHRGRREDQLKQAREVLTLNKTQVDDGTIGSELFKRLWARGEPMYISGACEMPISPELQPSALAKRFGSEPCELVQLSTQALTRSSLGQYFADFGVPKLDPAHCYKLRDLSSAAEFKAKLPALRQFYLDSLPMPDLLRTDGFLNLAAHTPVNAVPPDLGPRLVSSYGGPDKPPNVGLTNLHREVADVANLMVYGTPNPSQPLGDKPGCSRWDIFRAEDSEALTSFVCEELGKKSKQTGEQYAETHDDPVLSELNYLSQDQLKQLARRGVLPHVIWQRPGDLVLVPAGCAYQVCNFADCLNVSSEFISAESLARSIPLHEFGHAQTKERQIWKHDPIQFKTQLLWAWQSCDLVEARAA